MKDQSSKPQRTLRSRRKSGKAAFIRVMEFPQARGRTVERVELIVNSGCHCVSIRFQDKTDLSVMVDPLLIFNAEFSDWKTHDQRVLKRWAAIRIDS